MSCAGQSTAQRCARRLALLPLSSAGPAPRSGKTRGPGGAHAGKEEERQAPLLPGAAWVSWDACRAERVGARMTQRVRGGAGRGGKLRCIRATREAAGPGVADSRRGERSSAGGRATAGLGTALPRGLGCADCRHSSEGAGPDRSPGCSGALSGAASCLWGGPAPGWPDLVSRMLPR